MRLQLARLVFLLIFAPSMVQAHPTTPNQAIQASTIAELFIEDSQIRLELEIGARDLKVFQVLLKPSGPEGIRSQQRFLEREFVLEADEEILPGKIVRVENRKRVPRDPITGEPIPRKDVEEQVTFVEIQYPLSAKPRDLIIKPPFALDGPAANIGIVMYHRGMPINDFDYLNYRETVRLDWQDPWYSRIRSPRLKRYYNAPASVFVYVDPREVRLEIMLRLKDLMSWVELDLSIEGRETLSKKISDFLLHKIELKIDESTVNPSVDQLQLLRLNLAKIETVKKFEGAVPDSTMIGLVLVSPTPRRAKEVSFRWNLFSDRVATVPVTLNQSQVPSLLSSSDSELKWKGTFAEDSLALDILRRKPERKQWTLSIPGLILGVLGMGCLCVRSISPPGKWSRYVAGLCVIGLGIGLWSTGQFRVNDPFSGPRPLTEAEATQVISALLKNVYHSFDFRGEEAIYDTLSQTVAGELLRQTYLDIQKSLEVQNQTAKAKEVVLNSVQLTPLTKDTGMKTHCRWTVRAAVTHWGHTHERTQQYEGDLTIQWRDDTWKITALTLLDQKEVPATENSALGGKQP